VVWLSFDKRRLIGDVTEVITMTRGYLGQSREGETVPIGGRLEGEGGGTDRRRLGERSNGDTKRKLFTEQTVRIWNALPECVGETGSIEDFQKELD